MRSGLRSLKNSCFKKSTLAHHVSGGLFFVIYGGNDYLKQFYLVNTAGFNFEKINI
jgi:hypothetical protein